MLFDVSKEEAVLNMTDLSVFKNDLWQRMQVLKLQQLQQRRETEET